MNKYSKLEREYLLKEIELYKEGEVEKIIADIKEEFIVNIYTN